MTDNQETVKRAAEHIIKSRQKKRRSPEGGAAKTPATKKKVRGRAISFDPEHLTPLSKNLGCTRFFCPLTGKTALFSALSTEPMYYYAYPVVLQAPEAKGRLPPNAKTLCGVSKPELVFSVLHKTFADIFPELEAQRIADWDVFRWNVAYYGQGIMKRAAAWKDLKTKLVQLRPYGGDKLATFVNVFTESGTNKSDKAKDLVEIFANDPSSPECLSRQVLIGMRADAYKKAEEGGLLAIDKKKLEDRVAGQEEDSESDESEQDESDDE